MTSLLSSISGQFGRMVVLGSLFPVVILSILNVVVVAPLLPATSGIQAQLTKVALGEANWAAVSLMFVVLVLTGLLYNLNIPIIRLYEGYPWQASWVGALFTFRKRQLLQEATSLRSSLRNLRHELQTRDPGAPQSDSLAEQQTALARLLVTELPDREDLVLPTRLGNVIRCFESYPYIAYGMDAIVLWPRLISRIDSGFAASIDDSKASFDFMLNCSFLSTLTSVGILAIGLFQRTALTLTVPWLWRWVLFMALACIFYELSIRRAGAWGTQVRAAFDLYRFDLLKALGYQQQPQTFLEEQALWRRLSVQLLYPDARDRPLPYKTPTTRVVASPPGLYLVATRKLTLVAVSGHVEVEVSIENKDTRTANTLMLVETIPDGYKFVLQSARGAPGPLRVSNLNPVELVVDQVDPIHPGSKAVVMYTIKPGTA